MENYQLENLRQSVSCCVDLYEFACLLAHWSHSCVSIRHTSARGVAIVQLQPRCTQLTVILHACAFHFGFQCLKKPYPLGTKGSIAPTGYALSFLVFVDHIRVWAWPSIFLCVQKWSVMPALSCEVDRHFNSTTVPIHAHMRRP